jgi:hypothetical protein
MVTKETILPNVADNNVPNGALPINHIRDHEIYGVYPTMGFKPFNAFYPIDTGYIHVEASNCPSLRIA